MSESEQRYFIHKGIFISDPWKVVRREVETRCPITGLPLSFVLVSVPGRFNEAGDAQKLADKLNEKARAL